MSKIGIMGGTFDPIHNGHLRLARQAYYEYRLDLIWFMPTGHPPHKKDHQVTDSAVRCEMVEAAIAGYPYFQCSDFEAKRSGDTYTAQTLRLLRQEYPKEEFYFIIGADSLYEIESWYHPEQVMAQAVLLVAGRNYRKSHRDLSEQIAFLKEKYGAKIYLLHCDVYDVASAQIRTMASEGLSIRPYVPEPVLEYIKKHRLYQYQEVSMNSSFSPDQVTLYRKRLKSKLAPMRYEHSLSVSYTSMCLAMYYGYDISKAEIAGLLHDCGKRFSDDIILKKCLQHKIPLTEEQRLAPAVLHANYGAWLAEHKYEIHDQDILNAILYHTTGRPEMSMLEKIVYIADYIEPRRYKASNLPEMRRLAFCDLDEALYQILKGTLEYLGQKKASADPMTCQAYEYYAALRDAKTPQETIARKDV